MSLLEMTIADFEAELASKSAVPGGGGASALVASLGAALGTMVGNLTVGKKKYAEHEDEMKILMEKMEDVRHKLMELVDRDAEVFLPLSRAYAIPKDAVNRDEIMEICLYEAALVPLSIMECSCEAIDIMEGFAENGSVLAISDAGTGVMFCQSAMFGAALNVMVNTKSMKNREVADEMNEKVQKLMQDYKIKADTIYNSVFEKMR